MYCWHTLPAVEIRGGWCMLLCFFDFLKSRACERARPSVMTLATQSRNRWQFNIFQSRSNLFRWFSFRYMKQQACQWTHVHAHTNTQTHVYGLKRTCPFQDRCKFNKVLVSELGPQWNKKLHVWNKCFRKIIHSGPLEQDPSVWM